MISCKEYSTKEKERIKKFIKDQTVKPKLCVIQIGDNQASNSYIKGKKKDCEEIGIICRHYKFTENIDQKIIEDTIDRLNKDHSVNGIIIQLPIPKKFDLLKLQSFISPAKDVDGFRRDSYFTPCTPKGIVNWLSFNNYNFNGCKAVVIGRSAIVGKPLAQLLIDFNCTVTSCNSHTKNIAEYTKNADLIISAIGKAKYFDVSYFSDNQVIVDVGINRDENGKLCGDINHDQMHYVYNTYVTPVPGGVGLLTRTALLSNTLDGYMIQNNKSN